MPCPSGKYSTGGAFVCTQCSQHHRCLDGVEIPCLEGEEQSLLGQTTCTHCTNGNWSISGSGCVDPCGKGYYCAAGQRTACSSGETTNITFASEDSHCIPCEPGYKCTESSNIYSRLPCGTGRYSLAGSSVCAACPNGTWVATNTSTSEANCTSAACDQHHACVGGVKTVCPAGKDTFYYGSSFCEDCPPGKHSSSGSACDAASCLAGHQCINGVMQACVPGKYSAGAASCEECPEGTWSTLGSPSSGCNTTNCGDGYFCYRGFRSACRDGKYSNAGARYGHECLSSLCPPGYYCLAGAVKTLCQAGRYSIGGASACTFCPAGKYGDVSGSNSSVFCSQCHAGSYCIHGDEIPCAIGHFSSGVENEVCTACENGKTTLSPGTSSCVPCPAGHYCENGVNTKCPTGKWSLVSSDSVSDCTPCSDGKSTVIMTPTSTPASEVGYCTSNNCVLGTYCVAGIDTLCPEGKYTLSTGSTACTENCPNGKHSVLGARTVDDCTTTSCSAGYYCVGGVKTACADGKWSNPGAAAAGDCTTALCTAQGSGIQCKNGYLIG